MKEEHFEADIGAEVQVRLIHSVNEEKELTCELKALNKNSITVLTDDGEAEIALDDIAFVRLYEDYV